MIEIKHVHSIFLASWKQNHFSKIFFYFFTPPLLSLYLENRWKKMLPRKNKKSTKIKKNECCEKEGPYTEKIHGKCFKTTNEENCLK